MPVSADAPELPDLEAVRAAAARIRPAIPPTPAFPAQDLSASLGTELWVKAESLQRTGSFKVRGAYNWTATATAEETGNGLITVSAGNHAMALAWAAERQGVPVTVVMPEGSSTMKIETTRAFGAEVIIHGDIKAAVAECHRLREERGLTLVHPYDNPRIMAGQGTVGLEMLEQIPRLGRVLCPIGGGGLVSGLGIAIRSQRPDIELIGVEPEGAATMRNAWDRDSAEAALDGVSTIAPSLAPVVVGKYTYAASRRWVNDIVTVSDDAIARATRALMTQGRLYVETGAAVGLAAVLDGAVPAAAEGATALVITGGNMDTAQARELLA
ncbi:Phenylserine dehydratase [wastewater metagenome]|uniref:Phenylserine dehydratase n=2 Tax=unclassified sequences TaxID=12908 RepID=A0A5B8R6Q7_9ZZZZ|nr:MULTISPECIES: threonine/serine dehydratase [Arhodomonas]MCS4503760.1 threonine/serine dehydratase [Arhodomonas aquaeolei]QEA04709.1 phenylserine dehydratase [uncultured organism]